MDAPATLEGEGEGEGGSVRKYTVIAISSLLQRLSDGFNSGIVSL